jgi:sugar phosphate isomerase/epimerase
MLPSREFITSTATAAAVYGLGKNSQAAEANRFKLIGFIKPFQKLPYAQIADVAAEIGWNGIECPVRKGGTIEPPQAEGELPKLVEALKKNGLELSVIASDVDDAKDPLTRSVLTTASALGIKQYRLKHYYYDLSKPIAPQLESLKAKVKELAALNSELKIQGSIQNHSGKNYVGAPVWDIWELVKDQDRNAMAAYFDIGHATLEGGQCWPLHAKLVEPMLGVVSVKEFVWKHVELRPNDRAPKEKNDWRSEWCPLGDGMVRPEFFTSLMNSAFTGPISQHFEYEVGSGQEMIRAMKKELGVLKEWLRV